MLIGKTFEVNQEDLQGKSVQSFADGTVINNIVGKSTVTVEKKEVMNVGFFSYYLTCFNRTTQGEKSREFFRVARRFIDERLDVIALLHLYERLERLTKLTLNEEDMQQLNENRRRETVFN